MSFSAYPCPVCGNNVTQVRQTVGQRRSRVCPRCEAQFITHEVPDDDYRFLKVMSEMYGDTKRKVCDWWAQTKASNE